MSNTAYKPLPTEDSDTGQIQQRVRRPQRPYNRKRALITHFATLAAVMVVTYFGVRWLVCLTPRLRNPKKCGICADTAHTPSSLPTHYTLPSGDKIPAVALGTAGGGEVGPAVQMALKTGYRHIDGAWSYGNEAEVGQAIKQSGVPREQIWLTSKLGNSFHAPEDIEPALDDSLNKLGTDYLDLYLIHWPVAFKKDTDTIDEELTANPYPTWQKLEEMVEKGKVRNIGISNFNVQRIQNLTANPLKVTPAVNQVELNYWNPQPELLKWSKEHGMLLEAYSPLGSSRQVKETLEVPEVQAIAKELGITPAQAIISWHVQRGTIVLPKSVTPSRVEENFKVYRLPDHLFDQLETAANAHPPQRIVNPSERWGLDYDIFDDYPY